MTKKNTLLLLLAGSAGWLTLTSYSSGPSSGGLSDLSGTGCGSPSAGCHANNNPATVVQNVILVDVASGQATPPGQYLPGHMYTVSVLGNLNPANSTLTHFGFQTTARNSSNATVGSISITNNITTRTYTASNRTGVEHSTKIPKNSAGFFTETWRWTAPAAGTGPVTFYTAINAVNNNGNTNGDQPNVDTAVFTEGTLAVDDVTSASPLAIYPNPAKDRIRLDAKAWKTGMYYVTILNSTGSVVLRQSVQHTGAAEQVEVTLPNLATGLYGIRVQGEGTAQAAPLFIR